MDSPNLDHAGEAPVSNEDRLSLDDVVRLLARHHSRLLAYVTVVVHDRHLAEDVLQETSVIIINRAAEKTTAKLFPAWARRVARNVSFEMLRNRRGQVVASVEPAVLDSMESAWEELDEGGLLLARKLALRACMEKLSENSKALLKMKYEQSMSGTDMAGRLGRSVDGVYVTISRIHKALADCVKAQLAREART